jgi:hypothetical protein
MARARREISFLAFFLMWADLRGWKAPELHIAMCVWLENCKAPVRVLKIFRGAGKSTLYAVYKAWRLYRDCEHVSLVWSEDTKLAKKLTRDVIAILRRHPLCVGMLSKQVGAEQFWVTGATDARNASMAAYGVLSNTTGSRAHSVDFDDVEVPKNIRTPDAREKLRERIAEATHILVPGGQETYIGTPHTHHSLYDEQIEGGAEELRIALFGAHRRIGQVENRLRFPRPFDASHDGYYLFVGIGQQAQLVPVKVEGEHLVAATPVTGLVDIYARCAWPERFDRADLLRRRRRTRTLNAWDSQYQLESKPLHEVRLDPDLLRCYAVQPTLIRSNGQVRMMLGNTHIVSVGARWDCALGKVHRDVSAFCVLFADEAGHYFWHVADALTGDADAQSALIRKRVIEYQIPAVVVETNGPGTFAPPILRKVLAGTGCAVIDKFTTVNKNRRILDAIEAPLIGGFLWAHESVFDAVRDQMADWKPEVTVQPDDYLDAAAGAISEQPQRIGRVIADPQHVQIADWRPAGGVFEVQVH